jgi:hypothetical protein
MKKNLSTLLLTAAGMTLSAAAAYGQIPLKANVPFAFRTSNASLAAGKYAITNLEAGDARLMRIENLNSRHSIYLAGNPQVNKTPGKARLVFRCGEVSGCALAEAYTDDGHGWKFSPPRRTSEEKERVAVLLLHRADGE